MRVADVVDFYQQAQKRSAATHRVDGVELSERGSWSLGFRRRRAWWSVATRSQQRLAPFHRCDAAADAPAAADGFVYADLRYSNGFAVKWPDAAALPTPCPPRMREPRPMLPT